MDRAGKAEIIEKFQDKFAQAKMAALIDFRGLNVAKITDIRKALKESHTEYYVIKNTLAKVALKNTMLEPIKDRFTGPTGVALAFADPVASAKALMKFSQDHENFKIKAGVVEGKLIEREGLETLSKLPEKEVLLSQVLGLILAPAQQLLAQINAPASQIAGVIQAKIDKDEENQKNNE